MSDNPLIYDQLRVEDFEELDQQTKKVLGWIGNDKNGVEVGCHTGNLASWLIKSKCNTIGIDKNHFALEKAKPFLVQSILGNIEDESIWKKLENNKYDYITFLHVLEHLVNPGKVLIRGVSLLKDNGVIIVGLPNICNAKDRFNITFGKFEYSDIGVMDNSHLRFYNQHTAMELIENAGLQVEEYFSPWRVNPVKHFLDHIPLLWRLSKLMSEAPLRFLNFSPNITDTVMLFKCRKNV